MCTKKIVDKSFGIKSSWLCKRPEYKDGLCKRHYEAKIRKQTLFKDRPGYRQPTLLELKSGKTLYLKNMGSHGGFSFRKGVITNDGKETNLPVNPELFVIKDNIN